MRPSEVATEPVPPIHKRRGPAVLPAPPGRHVRRRLAGASDRRLVHRAAVAAVRRRPSRTSPTGWRCPSARALAGHRPARPRPAQPDLHRPAREPLLGSALMLLVAFGIGLPLALIAAERGRKVERVTSRLTEILMALPATILLLAVIGVIGNKIYVVMAILGVLISAERLPGDAGRGAVGAAAALRRRRPGQRPRLAAGQPACTCCRAMATVVAVQAAQLFGIGLLIQCRAGVPGLRSGRAAAQLGLHDPGRVQAHLRLALADGAHRSGAGDHRRRRQRARRRDRRQGAPPRSPASVARRRAPRRRVEHGGPRRPDRRARGPRPVGVGATTDRRWSPASRSPCSPAGCSGWSASPAAARR